MDLKRSRKLLLAIVTLWPFFYVFVLVVHWYLIAFDPNLSWPSLYVMAPLHILTLLDLLILLVVYVYLVLKRLAIEDSQRRMWLLVVILGGLIGQLVFFCLKIIPAGPSVAGPQPLSSPGLDG